MTRHMNLIFQRTTRHLQELFAGSCPDRSDKRVILLQTLKIRTYGVLRLYLYFTECFEFHMSPLQSQFEARSLPVSNKKSVRFLQSETNPK